ncbi:MAG: PDZ domain-containing protein [Mucilaginibacter sp.]|uniref:M61 family metallopeptidase n=1 Tax=Mucilaginibacter sp. TaxID=1882438 RepID=UPI0032630346
MNLNASAAAQPTSINYTVTFPEVQAHYINVEMTISDLKQNTVDVKIPIWTPGSYLIREFAKNVEGFTALANGVPLTAYKTSKNTWHIQNGTATTIKLNYRVYSYEISVRTSIADASSAFLSTSGLFMYPAGMLNQPSTIHIVPYQGWKTVSTSLDPVNGDQFTLYAPDYDTLFDSPIQVGNQDVFGFETGGVKYEVAMCGGGNYDKERLKHDLAKIIDEETAIFNENPNKRYVFIVHNYLKGGGGLEHLRSTVLGATRDGYTNETTYHNFLALAAHEHFHLWNVKRLRPMALGPFDYENENYTTNLWIAEGFTTYYQSVIVRRTNLYPAKDFLNIIAADLSLVDNQPGTKMQSLSEASFDTWIKLYRPNENSTNTTMSYYNKGAVIAMLLDLEIIQQSKARQSLDDVMKYAYQEYYKKQQRGYTDAEFKTTLEKFTGKNLDGFYKKYINGVDSIDYSAYLKYAGYRVIDTLVDTNYAYLGIKATTTATRHVVSVVTRNSPAWVAGLSFNDEIISIDGKSIPDLDKYILTKKPAEAIMIDLIRDGLPKQFKITLSRNPQVKYKLEEIAQPTDEQLAVRKKWMKL